MTVDCFVKVRAYHSSSTLSLLSSVLVKKRVFRPLRRKTGKFVAVSNLTAKVNKKKTKEYSKGAMMSSV